MVYIDDINPKNATIRVLRVTFSMGELSLSFKGQSVQLPSALRLAYSIGRYL